MFHRRLLLLAGAFGLLFVALFGQLSYLTLVEGAARQANAEAALSQFDLIPTRRGAILDAKGRMLAVDQISYDIAVRYPVLTGAWTYSQAYRRARAELRGVWHEFSYLQRERHIALHEQVIDREVEAFWNELCALGAIERTELDERIEEVKQRVQQMSSAVWLARLEQRQAALDSRAGTDGQTVSFADVAQPIGPHVATHPLVFDVDESARARLIRLKADAGRDSIWRQVEVVITRQRHYPLDEIEVTLDTSTFPAPLAGGRHDLVVRGSAMHIVGAMRKVQKEDVEQRPFRVVMADGQTGVDLGGYVDGDEAGRWGIEAAMERELRGLRGQVTQYLDTGREVRQEPIPGRDVQLSVDLMLQARVQAVMARFHEGGVGLMNSQPWHGKVRQPDDAPLNGAAVVIHVPTGQVLASVSVPTFSRRQLDEASDLLFADDLHRPWVNRVTGSAQGGVYQCGSTLKPLAYVAAITEGRLGLHQTIECTGYLDPPGDPTKYRCWIYKGYGATHGHLHGADALAQSCNIFFYTLGRRMGAQRLVTWYDRFGLGRPTGSELAEASGDLPPLDRAGQPGVRGFSVFDAIFMAIGQGPVRWTPLQAANAYATLARDGYQLAPTFLAYPERHRIDRVGNDLRVHPAAIEEALKGLHLAVTSEQGTGHHITIDSTRHRIFNIEGVKLHGKSGTADAPPLRVDSDGDGRITSRDQIVMDGDHAWFMCLAQKPGSSRPDFAIAVIVEYAGSGGAAAGPIVNQILHALRAEGYL